MGISSDGEKHSIKIKEILEKFEYSEIPEYNQFW